MRTRKNWLRHRQSAVEYLERRLVLSASGIAGNPWIPELTAPAEFEQDTSVGATLTLDLPALGWTAEDFSDAGGTTELPASQITWQLDPDVGTDTPEGASITADGVFTWTPTAGQEGTHEIIVIITDSTRDAGAPALADVERFTVNVAANSAPVVDLDGPDGDNDFEVDFTEGDPATAVVDSDATITDNGSTLASMTVTLTDFVDDGEELTFDTTGTDIVADTSTEGVIVFTGAGGGTASLADFQTVLRSLQYVNPSEDPTEGPRTVEVQVNDGLLDSDVATSTITVEAVDDAPVVDLDGPDGDNDFEVTFNEGDPPTAVADSDATIMDVDSDMLDSMTVTFTDFDDDGEELTFDLTGTDIVADTSTPGVIVFTGTGGGPGTVEDFQTVLRSLRYVNPSEDPSDENRTVTVVVNDGTSDSNTATSTITVVPANSAPDLQDPGPQNAVVDEELEVELMATDPEGDTISFQIDEDSPFFGTDDAPEIVVDGDDVFFRWTPPEAGVYTFTILATDDGDPERTDQETFTVTVAETAGAPVVDLDGPNGDTDFEVAFTEGDPEAPIADTDALIADSDSSMLASMTVTLTGFDDDGEDLEFDTTGTDIEADTSVAGTIVFTGSGGGTASVEDFQTVLRSLRYVNPSEDPTEGDRVVMVTVNDGTNDSNEATSTISVTAVDGNEAPVVDLNGEDEGGTSFAATYTEGDDPVAIVDTDATNGLTVTDADGGAMISSAMATIANPQDGDSEILAIDAGELTGNITVDAGSTPNMLILTGEDTLENYQAVLRTLTYVNSADTPTEGDRTVEVKVNDGVDDSEDATSTVTVDSLNAPPEVDLNGDDEGGVDFAATYTQGDPAVAIVDNDATNGLTVDDVDNENLQSATVTITNLADGADEVLAVNETLAGNLGISVDTSTEGVLTLSGEATLADYQDLLRTLTYENAADTPTEGDRLITVEVSDGVDTSPAATSTVTVEATDGDVEQMVAEGDGDDWPDAVDEVIDEIV